MVVKMAELKYYSIAVIPGDGTGPEVVNEGLKVLEAVSEKCNFKCIYCPVYGESLEKTTNIFRIKQVLTQTIRVK